MELAAGRFRDGDGRIFYYGELDGFDFFFYEGKQCFYDDSNQILCSIVSNNFDYLSPNHIACSHSKSLLKIRPRIENNMIVDVVLDLNYPLEVILREIKYLYGQKDLVESMVSGTQEKDANYLEIRGEKLYYAIKEKNKSIQRVKINNISRAIGLWLWDYLDEHNIAWEYRAKSYAAFRGQYQNPRKPEYYIDKYQRDSQLSDLLERTRECIEKKEVLPVG